VFYKGGGAKEENQMSENGNKTGKGKPVPNSEGTRFKPGRSGNPGGRPKTAPYSQACLEWLCAPVPGDRKGRSNAEAAVAALGEKALKGDLRAAAELADRAEGKARQSVAMENTALVSAFEKMKEAELRAYAESGALPEWFQGEASDARP
jgi:hypothetical protein